jgi:hypothetical protein
MPSPDELLAGRYRILERLGSGGMATVHRARDERLERDVAIKILLPNHAGDPATAARFEREARSLAAASHPGVVAVYDVDAGDPVVGREPFFVMELCPGGSLEDRLAGGRRMSPAELVPTLVSVADGLADLHRRGIVHRDVKPQNILFAADRAKLADFGLALADDGGDLSDLTTPGTAVGTFAYLAPEILTGGRATTAADMYALGVVAFVALTGERPRPADSMADLVAGSQTPAPPLSSRAPDLGPAFDDVGAAMLAPQPLDRPDALDVASRLTTALGRWTREGGAMRHAPARALVAAASVAAAPAAGPIADPLPDDEATTAFAMPLGETAFIPIGSSRRARDGEPTGPPSRRLAESLGWLLPAAAVAAVAVLAILVLPRLGDFLGGPAGPAGASVRPSASVGTGSPLVVPSASSLVAASPSPSIAMTPTLDPAIAALDELNAAIAAARGGPNGLKGKEANDLESLAGQVRRALTEGNLRAALDAARKLDRRISDLADKIGRDQAGRLKAASSDLLRALGG